MIKFKSLIVHDASPYVCLNFVIVLINTLAYIDFNSKQLTLSTNDFNFDVAEPQKKNLQIK